MPKIIHLKIPEVTPKTTPLADLVDILTVFNKALTEGFVPDPVDLTGPMISLVSITESSNNLAFQLNEQYVPEYRNLAQRIATGNYKGVARAQHEALVDLHEILNKCGWSVIFQGDELNGFIEAEISRSNPIPPVQDKNNIRGHAELFGQCIRVGGDTPKVRLRLANGLAISADTNIQLAKDVAKHLYEDVMVSGEAIWDAETWVLVSFKLQSLEACDLPTPSAAFQKLAELVGNSWRNVDAVSFVRELRYGNGNT